MLMRPCDYTDLQSSCSTSFPMDWLKSFQSLVSTFAPSSENLTMTPNLLFLTMLKKMGKLKKMLALTNWHWSEIIARSHSCCKGDCAQN